MILQYLEWLAALLGLFFFIAGTVGMLRFPDVYTRLHAVTKADTLGLGLICLSVALHRGDLLTALKLLLIWVLVLFASALLSHLIAASALHRGVHPWEAE